MARAVLVLMGHKDKPRIQRNAEKVAKALGHEIVSVQAAKASFVAQNPTFIAERLKAGKGSIAIVGCAVGEVDEAILVLKKNSLVGLMPAIGRWVERQNQP